MNNLNWEVLATKASYAEPTMRFDERLLSGLESTHILHFYDWDLPSATYGMFVDPLHYLNREGMQKRGLHLGKRPTGGGIIFHTWDMPFSVLVPSSSPYFSINTLENYAFVNGAVLRAVQRFLGQGEEALSLTPQDLPALCGSSSRFCMAQPTKYDLMLEGKKIAGAAQRKTKRGFLHQGTVSLRLPDSAWLSDCLLSGTEVQAAMEQYTFSLLPTISSKKQIKDAKETLRDLLYRALCEGR